MDCWTAAVARSSSATGERVNVISPSGVDGEFASPGAPVRASAAARAAGGDGFLLLGGSRRREHMPVLGGLGCERR